MSREGSHDHAIGEPTEVLEIIREECSPAISSVNMNALKHKETSELYIECDCLIRHEKERLKASANLSPVEVANLLQAKEEQLKEEFKVRLRKEIALLTQRADFILQNEQVRASYMLREAHRERQEKISALQTQLECKNLAGLMFVMCTEHRKNKLERLKLIEEYTNYIRALQDLLTEAQSLILNLSRGYKTAERVDSEWRSKMTKVLTEFQMFIHDYVKGTPETEQYFFDLPALLKTKAPTVDDPNEDPCDCISEEDDKEEQEVVKDDDKLWFQKLEGDCRPFVMFGDMGEFNPQQRHAVIKTQKHPKSAPKVWKEYAFNDMFVKADCSNLDKIKDELFDRLPQGQWECYAPDGPGSRFPNGVDGAASHMSFSRRTTAASIDYRRGTMGSILKIITSTNVQQPPETKAMLLGARDSMEIVSNTKLRSGRKPTDPSKVKLNIGSRRTSFFDEDRNPMAEHSATSSSSHEPEIPAKSSKDLEGEGDIEDLLSTLGSLHNDSLTVVQTHVPEKDHKIHYEKVCPMEKCQRMHVDSFMRSLPPYMRASPFTHFEQTFHEYKTCTPEQLEVLKKRIQIKKKKERADFDAPEPSLLGEWEARGGVAAQTSGDSLASPLPPCTCGDLATASDEAAGFVYNLGDLIPMKAALETIKKECFYDDRIEFNRFKVVGLTSETSLTQPKTNRLNEIRKVLRKHPSLLDMFQANAH